jgi:rhomboid protease GluP
MGGRLAQPPRETAAMMKTPIQPEPGNFASSRNSGYYRHAHFFEQGDAVPLPVRWRYKLDRWRSQLAAIFHPEPKPQRPRLCPSCGTLVGSTSSKCHMCGANVNYSFAAASKTLARFLPQTSPATYSILAICCVMYALSFVITMKVSGGAGAGGGLMSLGGIASQVSFRLGASLPLPYNMSQPWRLITAIFLHGGLLHIGFNMWVLMDIGPMVEEMYGSARYLFLFVVTGAVGYLVSSALGHFSVGASGSLLGLIGVILAATTGRTSYAARALRSALIRWLIYIAVFGLLMAGTDNAAHFGGLAAGYLLGRVMADRTPADLAERRRAEALGWVAGFAIAVSFGFMVFNYLQSA